MRESFVSTIDIRGQVNPKNSEFNYRLALVLEDKGFLDEAIKEYRQALRINPNNAETHYKLGFVLIGQWAIWRSNK